MITEGTDNLHRINGKPKVLFILPFTKWIDISAQSTAEIISWTSVRLLAFAVLSGFLLFCTKNYNAHKHQFVLCRFRSMLLKTVELIAAARADKPELKLGLLLEAFRAVCTEKASGYVTKEDVASGPPIMDLFKIINPK